MKRNKKNILKTKTVDDLTIFALDKLVDHEKRIKVLEVILLDTHLRRTSYEEVDRLFQSYQQPIPPPRVSSIRSGVILEKRQMEQMDPPSEFEHRRSSVDLWLEDLYSVQKSRRRTSSSSTTTFRKFVSWKKLSTLMSKSSLSSKSMLMVKPQEFP